MKKLFLIFLLFLAPLLMGQTSRGGSRCLGGCSFSKQNATPPPLQFTNGNPPNGQTTIPYGAGGSGFPFTTSGGIGTVAFMLGSGSVPAGLTLGLNGGLTGTPTTIQSYTFTVIATDSAVPPHVVTSPSYTVQITSGVPPPIITTTSFPSALLNVFYGSTAQATNGTQPYTWSQPSGSLPVGVRLNASTGVISGIPTTPGVSNFTLQVCDINSLCSAVTPFSITVTAPQLQITNSAPPNGQQNQVYTNFPFTSTGGFGAVSWSVISGSLPTGMNLSSGGILGGTPTVVNSFTFMVQAQDSETPPQTATQQYTIQITAAAAPPTIITGTPPAATLNSLYSFVMQGSGGMRPYTWSIISGALPNGITLTNSLNTGILGGAATQVGSFPITVQLCDAVPNCVTQPYTFVVNYPALQITNSAPPPGIQGMTYGPFSFTATGGSGTGYNWVFSGNFPTGLNLNSTNGAVTGTPTAANTFNFTISLNDSASNTAMQAYSVLIASPMVLPQLPLNWVNPHEFDADLANPAVTETIKVSGGTHPYTCAGIQSALNDWATDPLDRAYLVNIDPGVIPAVSGNCFNLPAKLGATHFIILQSSNPPNRNQVVCAGGLGTTQSGSVRNLGCASGTDLSHLWQISSTSSPGSVFSDNGNLDSGGNGPSHIVIRDAAMSPDPSVGTFNAIAQICQGSATTIAALCSHIHIQYSYIHGDAGDTFTVGHPPGNNIISAGATFNCNSCSWMWNYMDKITRPANGGGSEGHLIAILENTGPFRITNNWGEGASSSVFCGGGGVHPIAGIVSCNDGEIRVNHWTYPLAWLGANWGSTAAIRKNGYENKEGQRMLVDGNEIDTVDETGGQGGSCMVLTVRNTSGGPIGDNYTATLRDYTVSNNLFHKCLGFQNDPKSGGNGNGGGQVLGGERVLYYNNLGWDMNANTYCVGGQANTGGINACSPYRIPGIGDEDLTWTCSPSRDGVTNNITLTCADGGTGFHQTNVMIGDRVSVSGGSDATFDTSTSGLGPSGQPNGPPALTGTDGILTVVYNNGSTGAKTVPAIILTAIPHSGAAGTGYQVGDVLTVVEPGASSGTVTVSAVSSGVPTSYTVSAGGNLYGTATSLTTTGGHGTGATVDITAAGYTLHTNLGWWNGWSWIHNTMIASTSVTSTGAPNIVNGCPPNSTKSSYAQNMTIRDNLFALSGYAGFTGGGASEGSSGANPAESCMDLTTFVFHHNAFAERTAANYTAYPSGIKGNVAGSNLWFPTTVQCTSTNPQAPGQNCVGMPAMLTGVFNQTASDYHQYELCGGAGSPTGCTGTSLFAAGQTQQASDGTDLGANIPALDTAQSLNLYVCATACGTGPYPAIGKVIFVSPTGSDSNSGSPLSPVQSLNQARVLIGGTPGSMVVFTNGFYQSSTTTFGTGDSGTSSLPIVYRGMTTPDVNDSIGSDQAIISGGVILNTANGFTWTMGAGTCGGTCQEWDLTVPYTTFGAQQPEVMYYNGQRRIRPCAPYNSATKNCGYYFQSSPDGTHLVTFSSHMSAYFPLLGNAPTGNFECYGCYNRDPADTVAALHAMTGNCTTPGSCTGVQWVEILAFERWTGARMRLVPSFNDGTNTCTTTSITLCATGLTTAAPPNFGPYAGQRYILDNLAPADVPGGPQPGEFYVDPCVVNPSCSAGVESNVKIQYFANPGEHPNTDAPVFPVKNTVFVANGTANVNFRNFTVSHDNFTVALAGQPGISDASNIQAANSFQNTTGISFDHVNFAHLQHWSLEFVGFNGTPTSLTNSVSNASSWDLGTGNFRFGRIEASGDTCTPTCNIPQFLAVSNSQVSGMQRFMPGGVGLGFWWGNTQNDTGTNLSVSDTYSGAYGVGGSQGYCGTFNTFSGGVCTGTNHVFANNIVLTNVTAFNICQGVTSDCGAIHFHSALGTGNVLNGFDFRDVTQDPTNNAFWQGYNGICVYYDNSSSNVVVKRGQCIRASQANVLFNNAVDKNGQNNTMQNVILAYGKQGCIMKAVDSTVFQMTFLNNICYFDQGNSHNGPQFEGGSAWLTPTLWAMSHNTYFNTTTSLGTGTPWYQTVGMSRNYLSFGGWQSLNSNTNDSGSTSATNPNFVNPTCAGGDNYQFTSGAPSGFTTFSVSAFGAQGLQSLPSVPETFKLQTQNCNTFF